MDLSVNIYWVDITVSFFLGKIGSLVIASEWGLKYQKVVVIYQWFNLCSMLSFGLSWWWWYDAIYVCYRVLSPLNSNNNMKTILTNFCSIFKSCNFLVWKMPSLPLLWMKMLLIFRWTSTKRWTTSWDALWSEIEHRTEKKPEKLSAFCVYIHFNSALVFIVFSISMSKVEVKYCMCAT